MFSALSGITDFLKSTVTDDFKKPLQPSGLFASAIFILLNVLFVYPVLLQDEVQAVIAFRDIGATWQIALILAFSIILSYLLVSTNKGILKLFTGELWARSPILAHWLRRCYKKRLDSLRTLEEIESRIRADISKLKSVIKATSSQGEPNAGTGLSEQVAKMNAQITALLQEQLARKVRRQLKKIKRVLARLPGHPSKPRPKPKQLKKLQAELDNLITQLALLQQEDWETSTQFPAEEGHLAPTALGNVLSAVSSNVWQRYRIDIAALWPYMEGVIPKEFSLGKRLDDDRATLDFTINLAFLLLVFTAEYLLFRLVYPDALGQTLLIVAGLLAAYYVLYRTAVGTAKRWGQGVHMAFELHRKALRKQLVHRGVNPSPV